MEVSVKLSDLVDRARESVCNHLDKCASWRRKGMNAMIQLVHAYETNDETAAHAMTLLDRFLAVNVELKSEDQTVDHFHSGGVWDKADCYAIACYLIATKFKDVCAPCIAHMIRIVGTTWKKEVISQCEEEVLSSIGWALHVTTGDRPSQFSHILPRLIDSATYFASVSQLCCGLIVLRDCSI